MNGWWKFHRQMFENPVVNKDSEYFYVWCWILTYAAYEEKRVLFDGQDIILEKGQLLTTTKHIATSLNINESKVNRILKKLKNEKQIDKQTSSRNTLITVLNWNLYQESDKQNDEQVTNKRQTSEEQMTSNRQTNGKPSYYIKKERKEEIKEEKEQKEQKEAVESKDKKTNTTAKTKKEKVYYPNDEKLNQAFLDFMEMRKSIKKPMTDRAITRAMNMLQKLAGSDNDLAIQILEQSIYHCWQDLYELKDKNQSFRQTANTQNRSREEKLANLLGKIREEEEN